MAFEDRFDNINDQRCSTYFFTTPYPKTSGFYPPFSHYFFIIAILHFFNI